MISRSRSDIFLVISELIWISYSLPECRCPFYWMITNIHPIMLTIKARMIKKIWALSVISFNHMSFWCPFFDPHLTHHSNIISRSRRVFKLGPLTLTDASSPTTGCIGSSLPSHLRSKESIWCLLQPMAGWQVSLPDIVIRPWQGHQSQVIMCLLESSQE